MHTRLRKRAGQIEIFMMHSCFLVNKSRYNNNTYPGLSPAEKKKAFHVNEIATSTTLLCIKQAVDQIPPAYLLRIICIQ